MKRLGVKSSALLASVSCSSLYLVESVLKMHKDSQLPAGFKKYFCQGFFSSILCKDKEQENGFPEKSKGNLFSY